MPDEKDIKRNKRGIQKKSRMAKWINQLRFGFLKLNINLENPT